MIVLGFDTATPATAVGLMLGEGRVLEARDDPPLGERPGHSTRLLPLAHQLLEEAELGWREIDRIAVGVGPGTFTGLRIGVASARGLAYSLDVELVGVSSLHALAHSIPPERATGVLAAIDARRGEAFLAAYDDTGRELLAPRPLPPERFGEVLPNHRQSQWLAVGDGALRYAHALRDIGVELAPADSPLHRISARAVCELGAHATANDPRVLPDYRRAPDAQLQAGSSPQAAAVGETAV